ncbi:MAG: hypothetical protein HUU31_23105 [Anaerolineae bacterium]|nr:hypothetical protein [Anaerolineae bacterium]
MTICRRRRFRRCRGRCLHDPPGGAPAEGSAPPDERHPLRMIFVQIGRLCAKCRSPAVAS